MNGCGRQRSKDRRCGASDGDNAADMQVEDLGECVKDADTRSVAAARAGEDETTARLEMTNDKPPSGCLHVDESNITARIPLYLGAMSMSDRPPFAIFASGARLVPE